MFKKPFLITELKQDNNELSVQKYFNEIRNLSCNESDLYELLIKKDQSAIEKLIKCNTKFVVSVAKKYYNKSLKITLNDLINEGNIGLIESANRFDPRHGVKFITFAVSYIRKYILLALNENSHSFSFPSGRINDINKLINELETHEIINGYPLSHGEALDILSDKFNKITIDSYYNIISKKMKSLNDIIPNGDDNEEIGNNLEDDNDSVDYDLILFSDKLPKIMDKLNNKEQTLVNLICGVGIGLDYNDKYIKNILGLSEKKYQTFKLNTFNKIKNKLV